MHLHKTAETEAVKNDRPVLRTETGSEEKNFTVFAMDTVMQFQIYGGNDDVEEKSPGENRRTGRYTFCDKRRKSHVGIKPEERGKVCRRSCKAGCSRHLKLCKDTDGALDISAYPIVKAWGFTTGETSHPR